MSAPEFEGAPARKTQQRNMKVATGIKVTPIMLLLLEDITQETLGFDVTDVFALDHKYHHLSNVSGVVGNAIQRF